MIIEINCQDIICNHIVLSLIGALIAIFLLFLYKCITVSTNITRGTFFIFFIIIFCVIYLILTIYSKYLPECNINIKKHTNDNELYDVDIGEYSN